MFTVHYVNFGSSAAQLPINALGTFFRSVQAQEEEESAKCVCLWFRKKIPRLNFFTRPAAADYKANKGELVIRNQSVLLAGKKQ